MFKRYLEIFFGGQKVNLMLGRWKLDKCDYKTFKKTDFSNMDHSLPHSNFSELKIAKTITYSDLSKSFSVLTNKK